MMPRPTFISEKGQFSIEYLIAFVLFSVVLIYVSFEAAGFLPEILMERGRLRKDSEAHRIANFLTESELGFAEESYLWNQTKVETLENNCENDYDSVLEYLGLDEGSGVRIKRYGYEEGPGEEEVICEGPRVPRGVSLGRTSRFGYIEDDEIYRLEVIVW